MNLEAEFLVDRAYEDIPSEDVAGYLQRETSVLAWVIDGASTLTEHPFQHFPDLTDAGWFARRISTSLPQRFVERPFDPVGMGEVLAAARSDYFDAGAAGAPPWAWPVAAAVIVELDTIDGQLCIHRYADCFVETAEALPFAQLDRRYADAGSGEIRARWEPHSGFTGSTLAKPRARRAEQQRNPATTALTLNASSAAHASVGRRSLQLPSAILLGSDGLSRLWDTYQVVTRAEAMRCLLTEGLAGLLQRLRAFEASHETGTPVRKRRDDATGLVLHLGRARQHTAMDGAAPD